MRRVADGALWLYGKKKAAGTIRQSSQLPRFDFDSTNVPGFGGAYLRNYNTIVLGTHILEILARNNPDDLIQIARADGNIGFVGTPEECGFLFGVEELDHVLGDEPEDQPLHANQVTRAEYNAQKHEFESLYWRILAAEENKFHKETIDFLKEMQTEVVEFRAQHIRS